MKNLKRTAAAFVSAILVMALLVGCGGSSSSTTDIADKIQSVLNAKQSASLDKVAEALAGVELTDEKVITAFTENGYYPDAETVNIVDESYGITWTYDTSSNTIREDYMLIVRQAADESGVMALCSAGESGIWEELEREKVWLEEQGHTNVEAELYVAIKKADGYPYIIIFDYSWTYTE